MRVGTVTERDSRLLHGAEARPLTAAVRRLREQYPYADPTLVVRAVIDARDGLAAFGYRDHERSAALIVEIATRDPRLATGLAEPEAAQPR